MFVMVFYMYFSCTIDEECTAYTFNVTGEKSCALINENSTQTIFVSSSEGHLYKMGG